LLEKGVEAELNIYGAGDPEAQGLVKQLNYLYIQNSVHFKGHVSDIPATLKKDAPDLLWFQSANKEPGGYAAFEISMSGLPQIFWDFMDTGDIRPIEAVFPSFTNLLRFVDYTQQLLLSSELRKETGNKQRNYVLENYEIKNHIHILENIFDA